MCKVGIYTLIQQRRHRQKWKSLQKSFALIDDFSGYSIKYSILKIKLESYFTMSAPPTKVRGLHALPLGS
jgi:hypothetical protein